MTKWNLFIFIIVIIIVLTLISPRFSKLIDNNNKKDIQKIQEIIALDMD